MSTQNKNELVGLAANPDTLPVLAEVGNAPTTAECSLSSPSGDEESACTITITSVEQLRVLLSDNGLNPANTYEIVIGGIAARYKGTDADLACLLLPCCPTEPAQSNNTFGSLIELADRKELLTKLPEGSKTWPALHSASVITLGLNKIELPYGSFKVIYSEMEQPSQINPIVREQIQKTYQPLINATSTKIQKSIDASLEHLLKLQTTNVVTKLMAVKGEYSELEAISDFDQLGSHVKLLGRLFAGSALPEMMLNPALKKLLGISLITPEFKFNPEQGLLISALFYAFIAANPLISQLTASIVALNTTSVEKLGKLASIDVDQGVWQAVGEAQKPVQPQDRAEKDKASLYTSIKEPEVKEYFWYDPLDVGDIDRREVTLTGKSFSLNAVQNLIDLGKKHPHFIPVIDYLLPYANASFTQSVAFRIPPLLIAGPPGIGKSKFLSDLSDVVGMGKNHLHASMYTCGSALVGISKHWSRASQGQVADAMLELQATNPLMIFDELDRLPERIYGNGIPPLTTLMRLLEPSEAKNFRDAFNVEPHDVSNVNWIFTCNQPRSIPYALMTRLHVIYVYPPRDDQAIDNVHLSIWKHFIDSFKMNGAVYEQLDPEVLVALRETYFDDLHFRKTYKMLERALNNVISNLKPGDRVYLTAELLLSKISSQDKPPASRMLN